MDRGILHCDCNSFFASAETLMQPELKGKPVAVAGDPDSRHGIVLAASIEAKRYGIKTTDTVYLARKKCPEVVFVRPHHNFYSSLSKDINKIYLEYTDLVEPFSVDESFIDLTGTTRYINGEFVEIADELRARIKEEIGITISVGASFNKCFAKLGSDMKKPDATTFIPREKMKEIVWPLPVSDMLFVGKSTTQSLDGIGIRTIGDLATYSREKLIAQFGKHGGYMWDYANGLDDEPVHSYYEEREVKSVSNGFTFPRDLTTMDEIRGGVNALADSVAYRLREKKLLAYTVSVQIKDRDFHTISRQKALQVPTHLRKEISEIAMELIRNNWTGEIPIRLITVGCADLVHEDEAGQQLSLFSDESLEEREKLERLEDAVTSIQKKLGKGSIAFGINRVSKETKTGKGES
ncbi:MAG: DNA polymerase IV [Oscillospiraceae bacterium]|nr:DNA polymerase IV [Oscillospiraceae bacterium]MBR0450980.1 DNA polymerase IV [Oscillospiraceae bacterium]